MVSPTTLFLSSSHRAHHRFDRRLADCDSACAQMLQEEAVSGRVLAVTLPPPAPRPPRTPLALNPAPADVRREGFPLPRK